MEQSPQTMLEFRLQKSKEAFAARDFRLALVEAEELLDHHPDDIDALMIVGDASLEMGEALGAEAAFCRILEFRPDSISALCGLAIAHFELTDVESAITTANLALEQSEQCGEAFYVRALAWELTGQQDLADADFASAEKLEPDHYRIPARPDTERWEEVVQAAISLLHADLQGWIDGIELQVVAGPQISRLREAAPPLSPSSLALYIGKTPGPESDPWVVKPERIEIYALNVMRAALRDNGLVESVFTGLRRECLEWLGLPRDAYSEPDGA